MGIFSKDKKTKVELAPEAYPGQRKMLGGIAKTAEPLALERLRRAGEPYQGPLVAALSEFEEKGLEGLGEYLESPLPTEGELYGATEEQIMKILSEESNEEYIQAYKTQMLRELEEAKDRLAARASAGDKLFGGGRIATEGEMEEDFLGNLAVLRAEMDERRKNRILSAVPQALALTQYGEAAPVARIATSQQLGELPRLIEQAQMDAEYNEWMRALNDLGIALDTATGLATYQPGYFTKTTGGTKQWVQDAAIAMQLASGMGGLSPQIGAMSAGVSPAGAMTATGRTPSGGFVFG